MNWRVYLRWPKSDVSEWTPIHAPTAEDAMAIVRKRYAGYRIDTRPVITRAVPILTAQQWAELDGAA